MSAFKKIQSHFAAAPTNGDPAESIELGKLVAQIHHEILATSRSYYELYPSKSETLKGLKKQPALQAKVARFLFQDRHAIMVPPKPIAHPSPWDILRYPGFAIFKSLAGTNLQIAPTELLSWVQGFKANKTPATSRYKIWLENWPIAALIQQVERKAKKEPLSKKALGQLRDIAAWPEMQKERSNYNFGTDFTKVALRIQAILLAHEGIDTAQLPYKKLSGDAFGDAIEAKLSWMDDHSANKRHRIFNHAATASTGKPSKKFLTASDALKAEFGKEWLRSELQGWLELANGAKVTEVTTSWPNLIFFTKSNATLLKGLIWICQGYQDNRTVHLIADLCEKSMKKLPNNGIASQSVANACLSYLEATPGTEVAARLSRLLGLIRQKSVRTRVESAIQAKAQKAGLTPLQLQERVVPAYGLYLGHKTVSFDDYTLDIQVDGPGRVIQTWRKPDGTVQKTKPSFIAQKSAHKAKLDKTKSEVTNLKKVLTAQRDRIDRLFAEDLKWPLEEVMAHYVCHDLVCTIAADLIWTLHTKGKVTPAVFQNGAWQDVDGKAVDTDTSTRVRLWHPIDHSTDAIMKWRDRIGMLGIMQPTKQAFREVYVLTDAERSTDVYSNRMAAHMLKQHQMATLMGARGWTYRLMGMYDDGLDDQWAYKTFETCNLTAEYLIHTHWDEDNYNDMGIYNYVGTDQLRFMQRGGPVSLEAVPIRLLSETMREADLFVGVASVGNDPNWHDQGPTPESRNYWYAYAFGGLDNFAETRKQVLESLLPRLKIRDRAHIEGKFLVVEGQLNTYKIHLGSANILMAPGDRYLCIVPGPASKGDSVALPFDGDSRLSVILSKALMLADDDRITKKDIVSQLGR